MRTVVVGGGLSGLFTACELIADGIEDVVIVEAADTPGGVARTIERDGFKLEPGVGSVTLPHPDLSPILGRVGARMEPAGSSTSSRYVYTNGSLVEVPASPRSLLAPVMPMIQKLRALAEPLAPRGRLPIDESLRDFCQRRFGRGAGSMIAWLMASGVYAGDPKRLSAKSAFPMLADLESMHGSVIRGALRSRRERPSDAPIPQPHVPVGGMSSLARSAVDYIGDRYRGGFEVQSVHREGDRWVVTGPDTVAADTVVLACHPVRAADLVDEGLGAHLSRAESAPVIVVGLGGEGADLLPSGFGALVGPSEDMIIRGVLFESSYVPGCSPQGSWLVKVIAGGATDPGVIDWDDDRLVQRVGEETARVLGADVEASFIEVVRHRPGIPQYVVGHGAWLRELNRLLAERPGLHLTGWGYRGVGMVRLATDAKRVGRAVAAELASQT